MTREFKTTSESQSEWKARVVFRRPYQDGDCPSLESLDRRYCASEKSWLKKWLSGQDDFVHNIKHSAK